MIYNLWVVLIFIVVFFVLFYDVFKWSVFIGFVCIFVVAFFIFFVVMILFKIRCGLVKCVDECINIVGEFINGMCVIKYYVWENMFVDRVRKIRDREVGLVWKL